MTQPHMDAAGATHSGADSPRARVSVLMMRVDGTGGLPRTVLNLASALADHYDVEIISVLNAFSEHAFDVDPRIAVRTLVDLRQVNLAGKRPRRKVHDVEPISDDEFKVRSEAMQQPSRIVPDEGILSAWADVALVAALRDLDTDILLSTKPALNAFAAEFAPDHVVTIGQDHLNFITRTRRNERRILMEKAIAGLDRFVTLTDADAVDYRALVPAAAFRITSIPNAVSWPVDSEPAPLTAKIVLAAGRFTSQKAFPRLVDAYAQVARTRPDWQLHIYGHGDQEEAIRHRIAVHKIADQVQVRDYTRNFPEVMAAASVYAMSSAFEGFPMVLLEAMCKGVPMVSYDIPRGPAEIIRDGVNGRLIPDGDEAGFTAALLQLIDDHERRVEMGYRAWQDARQYEMPEIVARWRTLFDEAMQR